MNNPAQIETILKGQLSSTRSLPNDRAITIGRDTQDQIQLNTIPATLRSFMQITPTDQGHEIEMLREVPSDFGLVSLDGVPLVLGNAYPLHDGLMIQIGPHVQLKYSLHIIDETYETLGLGSLFELKPRMSQPHPEVDPKRHLSKYLPLLPGMFHDNNFLDRYLQIFETIWEPLETRQDHLSAYFDPRTAPAQFLPWLASWFDMELSAHWPEPSRRELIAHAAFLDQHRGTRIGLRDALIHAFGCQVEINDDPNQPFVFRVRLEEDPETPINRSLLEQVIQQYKPAHAGYMLEVQTRPALPAENPTATTQPESGGQQSREA
jgi:phage tail-like protein